jgi:pyridoxal phosphate enzyme (YggS family)
MMDIPFGINTIKENIEHVTGNIKTAAMRAGRDPESVRIVVVTKGHPPESLIDAVAAGAFRIGENYVEEAMEKMTFLSAQDEVEWHMIGHIQSRKARQVAENFDFIHSLDSYKLAARLDRFSGELDRRLPVLLECNVSGEGSKYGFSAWDMEQWKAIAEVAGQVAALPNLAVRGLMTMPPYFDDPEKARRYFQRLVQLRDYLRDELPQVEWDELSMGMSGDYEIAVEEGATLVRIGTAIMGTRPD